MTHADLLAFLRMHRLAVVSTVHDGAPQAAVISIAVRTNTLTTSRKDQNLRADPRAALVRPRLVRFSDFGMAPAKIEEIELG